MVSLTLVAIFVGSAVVVALLFYSLWDLINNRATQGVQKLSVSMDRAGISKRQPDQWVLQWAASTALLWGAFVFIAHPSIPGGILALPVAGGICAVAILLFVRIRLQRRIAQFTQQLELSLRIMSSALRVGLGLRQAIALTVEEMPEPSRSEFMRIIGQVNIGVSVYDALDDLAARMPGNETQMMTRVIRIQSQTGGDLAHILEHLANTIKERRRMKRKITALTSEGRASSIVLIAIPIALALIISAVQPKMGHALFLTNSGHVVLMVILFLEICAVIVLNRIVKVDFA